MMRALFAVSGLLAILISVGALVVHQPAGTAPPAAIGASPAASTPSESQPKRPEIMLIAAISEDEGAPELLAPEDEGNWDYDDTCPGDPRLLEMPGGDQLRAEQEEREPEDRVAMADPVFDPNRSRPSPTREELEDDVETEPAQAEAESEADIAEENVADPLDQLFEEEETEPEFSPAMVDLRERMRDCMDWYYFHPENTGERSCWGIMHSFIAYGADTYIEVGGRGGTQVNGIGWLCWNQPCNGQRILYLSNGSLAVRQGPGYQGHAGQLLAMLAQCRVPRDYVLKVNDREYTVEDLIEYEKKTCEPNSELTFKLIGLMHYLDSDETWTDNRGRKWSIPRLIREELAQPVVGAACGGTHRMMGFSYAVRLRRIRGEEFEGQWERARQFVEDYHDYTLGMQNQDGSFSTEWFAGRGSDPDIDRRLQTSGHILEWLVYSLPAEQLQDENIVRAVDYLTTLMYENRGRAWEIGPKGHALHALVLYDRRVFGGSEREELSPELMAEVVEPARRSAPRSSSSSSSSPSNSGSFRLFRRSR